MSRLRDGYTNLTRRRPGGRVEKRFGSLLVTLQQISPPAVPGLVGDGAEWVVRMHHPGAVDALPDLLDAARLGIEWPARHQAMVERCEELMRTAEAARSTQALHLWRARLRATEQWHE